MRLLLQAICIVFICFQSYSYGQDYYPFKKDGREGLKDSKGREVIPAVYDKLGWTEGEFELIGDLIGFELDGKWGIVNVRNKVIQNPRYYKLELIGDQFILAAVKGTISNRLFYGLIDEKGDIVISCNYFDIIPHNDFFKVSTYEHSGIRYGLIDKKYTIIIPIKYKKIEMLSPHIWAGMNDNYKWVLFSNTGEKLLNETIDKYELKKDFIEITREGKKGAISPEGEIIHSVKYKNVSREEALRHPVWEVYSLELDSINSFKADSVGLNGELFITYINGNQEVILNTEDIFGDKLIEIKEAKSGFLVGEDLQTDEWFLATTAGRIITSGEDSIAFDDVYFYTLNDDQWEVYNRFGRKVSARKFDEVGYSKNGMITVKKNNYWGLVDFQGNQVTTFKFEEVGRGTRNGIQVKYLNNWGVIDGYGNWMLNPEFQEIIFMGSIVLAYKKPTLYIYDQNFELLSKVSARAKARKDFVEIINEEGYKGMVSTDGMIISDPIYDSVTYFHDRYFGYLEGNVVMRDERGHILFNTDYRVSDVYGFSEGYYKIKRDGKFGFVDQNGKLRIANRYDDAGMFNENRCPVSLNGKWGYVDKREMLRIQPVFSEARDFHQSFAVIKKKNLYGLIDPFGNEIITPQYSNIELIEDVGYLLYTEEGDVGMADLSGQIKIRPTYERMSVVGNGLLIAYKKGKAGILDTSGYQRVPFQYEKIYVEGDYFFMKKLADN